MVTNSSNPDAVTESNDKMSAHPGSRNENGGDNTNYGVPVSDKNKTPKQQIAELARFHKLKHEYRTRVMADNNKLFNVQLVFTPLQTAEASSYRRIFSGSGASLNEAQQSAAAEALRTTTFSRPPEKNVKKQKINGDPSSPSVRLSDVCRRLKMVEPVYTMNSFYPPRGPAGMPPPPPNYQTPPTQSMMAHYPPLTPKAIVSPSSALSSSSAHSVAPSMELPLGRLRPKTNTLRTLNAPTHMCTIVMPSHHAVRAIAENEQEARNKAATQALCLLGPALAMLEQKMKEEKEAKRGKREETNKETIVDTENYVNDGPAVVDEDTVVRKDSTVPSESPSETQGGEAPSSSLSKTPKKTPKKPWPVMDYTLPSERNKPSREERKMRAAVELMEKASAKKRRGGRSAATTPAATPTKRPATEKKALINEKKSVSSGGGGMEADCKRHDPRDWKRMRILPRLLSSDDEDEDDEDTEQYECDDRLKEKLERLTNQLEEELRNGVKRHERCTATCLICSLSSCSYSMLSEGREAFSGTAS